MKNINTYFHNPYFYNTLTKEKANGVEINQRLFTKYKSGLRHCENSFCVRRKYKHFEDDSEYYVCNFNIKYLSY